MVVLEAGKGGMQNGSSHTGNMQPGTMVPGVDGQQGYHSNARNFSVVCNKKYPIRKLYQKIRKVNRNCNIFNS
jgi:hypothetical protein